jgi:hypothetical protein
LRKLIEKARETGGEVYLCTVTLPHDEGDALAPMREAISDGWRFVQQGRRWQELKKELGIAGTIRGDDEPTWGRRGWHPHFHCLLIFDHPPSPLQVERLSDHIYERWATRIIKHGYRQPSREHGVVITQSHGAEYILKLGLADELTGGLYKEPREGRLSPLQLLTRFEETQNRKYLELYAEFRTAYHGRRKLTYSRGLRARFLSTPETPDAELAALPDEHHDGEQFEYVFDVEDTRTWNRGLAYDPDRKAELLACARKAGSRGVELYLELTRGIVRLADRLRVSCCSPLKQLASWVHGPPAVGNIA